MDEIDALGLDPYDVQPTDTEPIEQEPVTDNTPPASPPETGNDDREILYSFLKENGITNPDKIKFDNDGQIVEKNWSELSKDEKLVILNTPRATESKESDYSQEEIDLIQQIRNSGYSPADYIASVSHNAEQAAQTQMYKIDDIDDDSLFVLDALDRLGEENVTDDQLQKMLEDAKSDPDLYQVLVTNLRTQYKNKEDEQLLQKQQLEEAQKELDFKNFSTSILQEIDSLDEVAGQKIKLSIEDKNELANYILTKDENGNSEFGKDMDNVQFFTRAAFWALKGNEIMKQINDHIKTAYEKGYAAGQKGQSKVVFSPPKDNKRPSVNAFSAEALDVV